MELKNLKHVRNTVLTGAAISTIGLFYVGFTGIGDHPPLSDMEQKIEEVSTIIKSPSISLETLADSHKADSLSVYARDLISARDFWVETFKDEISIIEETRLSNQKHASRMFYGFSASALVLLLSGVLLANKVYRKECKPPISRELYTP